MGVFIRRLSSPLLFYSTSQLRRRAAQKVRYSTLSIHSLAIRYCAFLFLFLLQTRKVLGVLFLREQPTINVVYQILWVSPEVMSK